MIRRILLIAACVFCSVPAAALCDGLDNRPPLFDSAVLNGLQVTARLSDYDYAVDEEIDVELWLTNKGGENLTVCIFPEDFTISAKLTTEEGDVFDTEDGYVSAGDPVEGIGYAKPDRADYVELRPSESWRPFGRKGIRLDAIIGRHMSVRHESLAPGTYELRIRFNQKVFDGGELGIRSWKGSVESNPVTLRILPVESVGELVGQLRAPLPWMRAEAAGLLGKAREVSAVPALVENLSNRRDLVRINCIRALGLIGDSRAAASLVELLEDDDRDVIDQAAIALGRIGDPRAVGPLGKLLAGDDGRKVAALRAFQLMPGIAPVKKILPLLGDASRSVRYEALKAVPVLFATDEKERREVASALISATEDEYAVIRGDAVAILPLLGDVPGVIAAIGGALDDESPYVRERAVTALGDLAPDSAADLIRPLLDDPDAGVRRAAMEALRKSAGNRIE